MSKFEKKFGKYAVSNLSLILILCYAVGYVIDLVNGSFLSWLSLDPYAILHGQVWRLFTWIIIPPSSLDPFTIIMLLFYYNIGTSLERTWGVYRYNVYILSGMLFTILGSFVWMGSQYFFGESILSLADHSQLASRLFSTYYVNMSIFLAFAATFPNVQVLLMFIIPIKVKWLGFLYGALLVYDFLTAQDIVLAAGIVIETAVLTRIVIGSSLLNFLIFFVTSRSRIHMTPKQMKRRMEFKQDVRRNSKITRHKCAVCGQTEDDNPDLEFRFCSKCKGNYEYCQHHLFTHTHVQ